MMHRLVWTRGQDMNDELIPVRYIGDVEVVLGHFGGPYKDANGKLLTDLVLRKGDTLMMRASEVKGMTVKFDPRGIADAEILGVGHIVKPEHEGLSTDDLVIQHGYQFHQGRTDFEPIVAEEAVQELPVRKK